MRPCPVGLQLQPSCNATATYVLPVPYVPLLRHRYLSLDVHSRRGCTVGRLQHEQLQCTHRHSHRAALVPHIPTTFPARRGSSPAAT